MKEKETDVELDMVAYRTNVVSPELQPPRTKLQVGKEIALTYVIQLFVLMEKNFILCKRRWKSSVLRVFHPIIFIFVLWILQDQQNNDANLHPPITTIGMIPKCHGENCITLLYSPFANESVYDIMSIVAEKHGFSMPSFDEAQEIDTFNSYPNVKMYDIMPTNSETQVQSFTRKFQNKTFAGISFDAPWGYDFSHRSYEVEPIAYAVHYNGTKSANFLARNKNKRPLDISLQVQAAVDSAIVEYSSGRPCQFTVGVKPFPTVNYPDSNENNPEDLFIYAAIPILACTHLITILTCLYEINWDRDKKLRQGLVMMGMKELPYWAHWFITQAIFVAFSSIFIYAIGYASGFSYFRNCNGMVLYLLFFVYGLSSFPVAFILSTFAKTPAKANVVAVIVFIASLIFAGLFISIIDTTHIINFGYDAVNTPFIGFLVRLFPATNFGQISADIMLRAGYQQLNTTYKMGPGFQWADLHEPVEYHGKTHTPTEGFGYFFLTMTVWCILAWYIDNVRPGEHGSKKVPYFFVLPSYWGFGKRSGAAVAVYKHNVKKLSSVLADMDADINREHQLAMEMAQNETPGAVILKLSKTYDGGARALDSLTLSCDVGSVLCLLGHNGAGKTTAISVMTGLYEATSGDALLFGYSVVYEMDHIRKIMGVCPQHDILWDELTAREHLRLFSRLKGISDTAKEISIRLHEVRLDTVADHFSSTFSGGMKRRLSVAIASIGDPKIIFMDEPTSGLDPRSRIQLAHLVQTMKKDKIIVLTTHSMEEADALADKIAILALGRLRATGDSLHLKNRYGDGYHINIVCDNNSTEQLIAQVQAKFPRARLRLQSAGNLVYTLPYSNHDDVTKFFHWIEHGTEYISDWGVSHTTLEEVFLRITHGESEEQAEENKETGISIMVEGIDQPIGNITVDSRTSLREARQLIGRLATSPPFFRFVHGSRTISPQQEPLHLAINYAPTLTIRTEEDGAKEEEEKEWENELDSSMRKIEDLRKENAELKKEAEEWAGEKEKMLQEREDWLREREGEREETARLLQENISIKQRLEELERLLGDPQRS